MTDEPRPPMSALVVDDDPFTRSMLTSAVTTLGWTPVHSATSVAEAMWKAAHYRLMVAVVDLDLGEGPTGIDLAHGLRRLHPTVGLVIISTYAEPRLIGLNLPSLPAGSIYLMKKSVTDNSVLHRAMHLAVDAKENAKTSGAMVTESLSSTKSVSDIQIEIMRLIAAGHSNAEIARMRVMSVSGVEKATARIIRLFEIPSGPETSQRVQIAQAYFRMTGSVSARRS